MSQAHSYERHPLDLFTADGRPLMHSFYQQEGDSRGILITFPGSHYGMYGPLLYYPSLLLREHGWDTLALSYGFQTAMEDPFTGGMEGMLEECTAASLHAVGRRDYPEIALVGKSLGCVVIAQLANHERIFQKAKLAYLTPVLGLPWFETTVRETGRPAYLAMGTADRFYDQETLQALQQQVDLQVQLVEGADHSLNFPGDLRKTVQVLNEVVEGLYRFIIEH